MDYHREYIEKNPHLHVSHGRHKAKQILQMLPHKNYKRVLDLACGPGNATLRIKRELNCEYMEGIDISEKILERARDLDKNHEVAWRRIDIFEYDNGKPFDLIICSDILEHVENDALFLKKIQEVGKAYVFRIPIEDFPLSRFLKQRGIYDLYEANKEQFGHLHFYNDAKLFNLMENAGLKVINYKYKTWHPLEIALYPVMGPLQKTFTQNIGGSMLMYLEKE